MGPPLCSHVPEKLGFALVLPFVTLTAVVFVTAMLLGISPIPEVGWLTIHAAVVVTGLATAPFYLQRKVLAPKLMATFFATLTACIVFENATADIDSGWIGLDWMLLIASLAWIAYLLGSDRVKRVFVK